ncbi:MAG: ATP/GTP-binding protein [Atopobiaceae bacterium]
MRILKFKIDGDGLYKEGKFSMDLYATDRVAQPRDGSALRGVSRLGNSNIYTQNVIALSGINASGKTTAIKLLRMVADYLSVPSDMRYDRYPSATIPAKLNEDFGLKAIFWDEGKYYALDAALRRGAADSIVPYVIQDERLYRFKKPYPTKKDMATFDGFIAQSELQIHRNAQGDEPGALSEDKKTFLQDSMSVVSAVVGKRIKKYGIVTGHLEEKSYATPLVNAFDGSIESLGWDPESEVYRLKFYGEPERQLSRNAAEGQLSSGTLVGADLVQHAINTLNHGGIMIVDEIERGLNKSLVATVMNLFLSPAINKNGAQLVFTTHYPEIIDGLPRKDDVYLLVRDKSYRTEVVKYSDKVKRIENKKSEVILSNFIKGSMPSYPKVRDLMDYVLASVKDGADE